MTVAHNTSLPIEHPSSKSLPTQQTPSGQKAKRISLKAHIALALTSGAASILALAPFFIWPILFVTLSILAIQLSMVLKAEETRKKTLWSSFVMGWSFGFGYFMAGLYWMGSALLVEADKFAWALPLIAFLPAFLALFYAAATALTFLFFVYVPRQKSAHFAVSPLLILALALSFAIMEWLRGHIFTGFPWNAIGYGWAGDEALMQTAALIGLYGLNLITILIFASPAVLASWWINRQSNHKLWQSVAFCLSMVSLLAIAYGYGVNRIKNATQITNPYVENVTLRLVQPNIPQIKKWDPQYRDWAIERYLTLSNSNAQGERDNLKAITHVIWPEVAWPVLMARDEPSLQKIADLLPQGKHLITGSLRIEQHEPKNIVYNSLFVFDDKAHLKSVYDKIHLVPFGEYLPFQDVFESIGLEQLTKLKGGFASGSGPRLLRATGVPLLSPLICYEIIFPNNVTAQDARPQWLLNVTNDAWFGATIGPHQHLQQARLRAVEEGLPVIRVANTGISAVVNAHGQILSSIALEQAGVIDTPLPKAINPTFFSIYRDMILFWMVIIGALFLTLLTSRAHTKMMDV